MLLKITYDKEVDVLFIELADVDGDITRDIAPGVFADFDADGRVISIEFLNASKKYRMNWGSFDRPDPYVPLSDAEQMVGISATTLRHQIHRGALKGKKVGRNWVVHYDDLNKYAQETSRKARPALVRQVASPVMVRETPTDYTTG